MKRRAAVAFGITIFMLLLTSINLAIFHDERNGTPAFAVGQIDTLTGDGLTTEQRREIGTTSLPAVALNHLLPPESKVLLIGDAKPFLYRANIIYQTTWDRGPLSVLMHEFPDQPTRWADELRKQGFTHVLADETMLRIWEQSGWNDPLLTRDRVVDFARRTMTAQFTYPPPNGVSIWRLRP